MWSTGKPDGGLQAEEPGSGLSEAFALILLTVFRCSLKVFLVMSSAYYIYNPPPPDVYSGYFSLV